MEGYTLNKNAWHARMMKWVLGFKTSDFSYMCPYFWLCVLCILIFIPYSIIRVACQFVLGPVIMFIYEPIEIAITDIITSNREEKELKKEQLYKQMYERYLNDEEYRMMLELNWNKYYNFFRDHLSYHNPQAYDRIKEAAIDRRYARERTERERMIARRKQIAMITRHFKWVFMSIISIAAILGLYKLVMFLVTHWQWRAVGSIGLAILIIFGCIFTVAMIGQALSKLNIGTPIWRFFTKVGKFFKLVFQMFGDMCPPITWK